MARRAVLAALVAAPLLAGVGGPPASAAEPSTVSGTVFYDLNGDREQQPDEPGAKGFRVWVNPTSDDAGYAAFTDASGHYRISGITSTGKFSVQLDGAGHEHTTPWAVGGSFGSGGVDAVQDFGIK